MAHARRSFTWACTIWRFIWPGSDAGVIGMPPHDCAPATRYAHLAGGAAELHRLEYDHGAARAEMIAAGLTQGYDAALGTGYWPSEDLLPDDLRMAVSDRG